MIVQLTSFSICAGRLLLSDCTQTAQDGVSCGATDLDEHDTTLTFLILFLVTFSPHLSKTLIILFNPEVIQLVIVCTILFFSYSVISTYAYVAKNKFHQIYHSLPS